MPQQKQRFTVFANDPGTRNYGYAIVQVDVTRKVNGDLTLKVKPREHGVNHYTLDDLKSPDETRRKLKEYLAWVKDKLTVYGCEVFAAERFMVRRASSGVTTEYIAFMLGAAFSRHRVGNRKIDPQVKRFRVMAASTWKNAFGRQFGKETLNTIYDAVIRAHKVDKLAITPHQVDAYLIGVHTAHNLLGFKGFEFLQTSFVKDLLRVAPSYESVKSKPKPKKPRKKKRKAKK